MELFVTDLDGTLLNKDREVSENSQLIINDLITKGVNFTVATARTPATAVEILNKLNLSIPVALMNGVLIYDIKKQQYIDIKAINNNSVEKVLTILKDFNKSPLVYGIKDNHLWVYHQDFDNPCEYNFYKERVDKPLKTFVKVLDYNEAIKGSKIINFVVFHEKDIIIEIYNQLKNVEGIFSNYYEDVYYPGNYFLEIHSSEASKAEGIRFLSKYVEHDKLITFGDNFNDLPMFEISDECYATANAVKEVKELATDVIGDCNNDGVAYFLKEYYKNK